MRAIIELMTETAGPSLRERKKAQTRTAIVAAALDLFERKGYDATTIDEIAEAADVSPRTFFRYFDSKIDVVMRPKDYDDDLGTALSDRPPDESPVDAMRQVMREMLEREAQDPLFVRQMKLIFTTPSLQAVARDHFGEHEEETCFDVSQRLGLPADDLRVIIITSALTNTIWTVISRWVAIDGTVEQLGEMIDEACALLSTGLDPRT